MICRKILILNLEAKMKWIDFLMELNLLDEFWISTFLKTVWEYKVHTT